MMSEIGLEFLPNDGGDSEGLSEAGIETFRDKPFAAVARETGQNSRDARLDPSMPVRLTFDVVTVRSSEFPSIDEFRKSARLCLQKARRSGSEKETGFFEHAVRALEVPEIKVLKISDYNTRGVRGPCQEGRPFHTLAKSDGVSTKEDASSGGSFGIGKNAAFALSDIQTTFFSTRYQSDDGTDHVLCMGKTLFMSHTGEDGRERRRKGYWGRKNTFMPLEDAGEIPRWLLRDAQGTSIFSICMRNNPTDWRYEMAAAIIMNFFCAIERQEMEFEIDGGSLRINKGTLERFFRDNKVLEAVKQLNADVRFEAAKALHTCLTDEKTKFVELDVKELGKVSMRILLREGLGYTVGIIRNGMYITDNLANFNEPFKRFPLHRDFAVIIEPEGKGEGEWFRRLENPRHDDLSADRITTPTLREQGQRAFRRLAKQIRDQIRELAKSEPTTRMELDELSDFFASESTRQEDDTGPETDPRILQPAQVKKSPPRPRSPVAVTNEDEDLPSAPGPGSLPPEPAPAPLPDGAPGPDLEHHSPGPVVRPQPRARSVEIEQSRNLIPDLDNGRTRRLLFTSPATGMLTLFVEATGLSNPDRLTIASVSEGVSKSGAAELVCRKGQRVILDVEFDVPYTGPIELSALVTPMIGEAA